MRRQGARQKWFPKDEVVRQVVHAGHMSGVIAGTYNAGAISTMPEIVGRVPQGMTAAMAAIGRRAAPLVLRSAYEEVGSWKRGHAPARTHHCSVPCPHSRELQHRPHTRRAFAVASR